MNLNDAPAPLFEADYAVWMDHQLELLRLGKFDQLDVDHLLEELGGTLRSERHAVEHRLGVVIVHLLKCQFQPDRKSRSWQSTLRTQRRCIQSVLKDSPSLRRMVFPYANSIYRSAVGQAAAETGLPLTTFPAELPYFEGQLLDSDFVP